MDEGTWLELGALTVLLIASAFFSGSETALLSMDRVRVQYLVHQQRRGARRLEAVLRRPDDLLGTILVGNNLVNIAASVFATTFFVRRFGARGELMTILILTPVLLILSEVCPKTLAARHPERISFFVLRPIRGAMVLLRPVVWLVTGLSRLLTYFIRSEPRPVISEEEIRAMITVGEQTGVVETEKRRMLHGIFELSEIRVRDVMIPRTEVVGIEASATFADALLTAQQSNHSRFPVYRESLDNVIGVIHSKDILRYADRPEAFALPELLRPPFFVPEAKPVNTLLQAFQNRRVHLAMVVDEYGGVEGIVTLEDVVEEIIGEIHDEYDAETAPFRDLGHGRYLVDGSVPLRELNQHFGFNLAEEHANTLAGFVLHSLGTIPEEGERCEADGMVFIVRRMLDRRIEQVEIRRKESPS